MEDQNENAKDNLINPDNNMKNNSDAARQNDDDIHKMTMDNKGIIHTSGNGAAVLSANSRLFTVLGWVSAALTAFVSPLFSIAGIVFGIILNRQAKGSGNMIVTTNLVLGVANFILGYFLFASRWKNML